MTVCVYNLTRNINIYYKINCNMYCWYNKLVAIIRFCRFAVLANTLCWSCDFLIVTIIDANVQY